MYAQLFIYVYRDHRSHISLAISLTRAAQFATHALQYSVTINRCLLQGGPPTGHERTSLQQHAYNMIR